MDFNRFTPKISKNKPANSKNGVIRTPVNGKTVEVQGEWEELNIKDVKFNPDQARIFVKDKDFLRLKDSIKREGVLHPMIVHKGADGSYTLIAGERRTRACLELGYTKAKYLVQKKESQRIFSAISTNEIQKAIHPINKGIEVQSIMDAYKAKGEKPPIKTIAEYFDVKESTIYEWRRYSDISKEIREKIVRLDIRSKDFLRKVTKVCKSVDTMDIADKEKVKMTDLLVDELIDKQGIKQDLEKGKVITSFKRSLNQVSEVLKDMNEEERSNLKKLVRAFGRSL